MFRGDVRVDITVRVVPRDTTLAMGGPETNSLVFTPGEDLDFKADLVALQARDLFLIAEKATRRKQDGRIDTG